MNCSGFDYSSDWNKNEWRCNGTNFERNEVNVSSSSISVSSSPLIPVQNEVLSYPSGLNELCSPVYPSQCDLRGSLKTCEILFNQYYDVDNVGSGCSIEMGGGFYELGSSQISLQLLATTSPLSISLFSSSSSSISVDNGVDISVGENETLSIDDIELSGMISSSSLFSIESGGSLNFSSCNISDFKLSDVSLVELDGGSFSSSNSIFSNLLFGIC